MMLLNQVGADFEDKILATLRMQSQLEARLNPAFAAKAAGLPGGNMEDEYKNLMADLGMDSSKPQNMGMPAGGMRLNSLPAVSM